MLWFIHLNFKNDINISKAVRSLHHCILGNIDIFQISQDHVNFRASKSVSTRQGSPLNKRVPCMDPPQKNGTQMNILTSSWLKPEGLHQCSLCVHLHLKWQSLRYKPFVKSIPCRLSTGNDYSHHWVLKKKDTHCHPLEKKTKKKTWQLHFHISGSS